MTFDNRYWFESLGIGSGIFMKNSLTLESWYRQPDIVTMRSALRGPIPAQTGECDPRPTTHAEDTHLVPALEKPRLTGEGQAGLRLSMGLGRLELPTFYKEAPSQTSVTLPECNPATP